MSIRTVFTTISPLPPNISREIVVDFLHDHQEMIDLNPLVKERHPIPPPPHAPPDELHCVWYSLTDKISYFPGVTGDVTYTCAFNDLSNGLQTHCYAPAGLTIRDKWTLQGFLPDEAPQPVELGLGAPPTGLYIREDVDMRCNMLLATFVKRTLKRSHAALIERLKTKAAIATQAIHSTGGAAADALGAIGGLSLVSSRESVGSPGRKRASSAASRSSMGSNGRVASWKPAGGSRPASRGGPVPGAGGVGLGIRVSAQTLQYYEQQLSGVSPQPQAQGTTPRHSPKNESMPVSTPPPPVRQYTPRQSPKYEPTVPVQQQHQQYARQSPKFESTPPPPPPPPVQYQQYQQQYQHQHQHQRQCQHQQQQSYVYQPQQPPPTTILRGETASLVPEPLKLSPGRSGGWNECGQLQKRGLGMGATLSGPFIAELE